MDCSLFCVCWLNLWLLLVCWFVQDCPDSFLLPLLLSFILLHHTTIALTSYIFPFFKNNLLCSWSYSTLIFCRAFLFLSCSSVHNSSHTYNKPFFMPKNSDQPKLNFNEKLLLQLLPVHIYQYCIPWRDLGLCIYSSKIQKLHLFL